MREETHMGMKKVGPLFVIPLLLATTLVPPYHKEPHTEQDPIAPEPALITDGAIISTHGGTAPALTMIAPNQFV
jgi:hypothetical protein